MMAKHYAPRAPLEIVDGDGRGRVEELVLSGKRVGWLTWAGIGDVAWAVKLEMPDQAAGYAARLYAALHELDAAGVERIVVARPPDGDAWLAVKDRLRHAAAK